MLETKLGRYRQNIEAAVSCMADQRIVPRIWAQDHTVWKENPAEIANRLGWLRIASTSMRNIDRMSELADQLRGSGYRQAVLLGMGGSSLAPEVFSKTFGPAEGYLSLSVIDSTDPKLILHYADTLDLSKTVFIVSTKSGGTVETLSLFKFFYNRTAEAVGRDKAGEHFVAITDPDSKLADLAERYSFRVTFLNDPNIGGRYSALSYFGLVPAALLGINLKRLLDRAVAAACACGDPDCEPDAAAADAAATGADANAGADAAANPAANAPPNPAAFAESNPAAVLGAVMGTLAARRAAKDRGAPRDKLTIFTSPGLESFGDWVEQLIAESTGKEGRGIVPVIGESLGAPECYGDDRLFVHLCLGASDDLDAGLDAIEGAGHPLLRIRLADAYDLGGQFFLWEMATAVAGHLLGINPFDQPNVESAKVRAREMMAAYTQSGSLPEDKAEPPEGAVLKKFLDRAKEGDYAALQAYVNPRPSTSQLLQQLRMEIRDRYRIATTVGYGPRFLHSTGQLHKGDGGAGLFLQFTDTTDRDAGIPDTAGEQASGASFGVLKTAQALGDKLALADNRRRVIRIHLGSDVDAALKQLLAGFRECG